MLKKRWLLKDLREFVDQNRIINIDLLLENFYNSFNNKSIYYIINNINQDIDKLNETDKYIFVNLLFMIINNKTLIFNQEVYNFILKILKNSKQYNYYSTLPLIEVININDKKIINIFKTNVIQEQKLVYFDITDKENILYKIDKNILYSLVYDYFEKIFNNKNSYIYKDLFNFILNNHIDIYYLKENNIEISYVINIVINSILIKNLNFKYDNKSLQYLITNNIIFEVTNNCYIINKNILLDFSKTLKNDKDKFNFLKIISNSIKEKNEIKNINIQ